MGTSVRYPGTCEASCSPRCKAKGAGWRRAPPWRSRTRSRTHASWWTGDSNPLGGKAHEHLRQDTCEKRIVFIIPPTRGPVFDHLEKRKKKKCARSVVSEFVRFKEGVEYAKNKNDMGENVLPQRSSILTPPNRLMILACPTNSSNQSSMVALLLQKFSGPLWLQRKVCLRIFGIYTLLFIKCNKLLRRYLSLFLPTYTFQKHLSKITKTKIPHYYAKKYIYISILNATRFIFLFFSKYENKRRGTHVIEWTAISWPSFHSFWTYW